jgi:hypothetical protein
MTFSLINILFVVITFFLHHLPLAIIISIAFIIIIIIIGF